MSTRDILGRIEADGWSTNSAHKMAMLRTTMNSVRNRHHEVQYEARGEDGAVYYAWIPNQADNLVEHAASVSDGGQGVR